MSNPILTAKVTHADKRLFSRIASSWSMLQNHMDGMDEDELAKMIKWELANQKRIYVLNRLKARFNRLRDARERREMYDDLFE